jgi:hypothetical protein
MRVAFCFFGGLGFYNDKNKSVYNPSKKSNDIIFLNSYNSFNNFFKKIEHKDIFIHSWSVNDKKKILNYYQPKKYIIQDQINFQINLNKIKYERNIFNFIKNLEKNSEQDPIELIKNHIFRYKSRWYSQKKSLELMEKYSKKMNISYDWVVQLRFDLVFKKFYDLNSLNANYIYLLKKNKNADSALSDFIIISSQKKSKDFKDLYDNFNENPIEATEALKYFLNKKNFLFSENFLENKDVLITRVFLDLKKNLGLLRFLVKLIPKFFIKKLINILNKLLSSLEYIYLKK